MTPKREAFCLAYIETGNASEAYRRAFSAENMKPETVNNKGYELLQKGEIRARLAELREPILERHGDTVDSLLGELEAARSRALAVDRPSAAVSATMGKARLLGLDRQQLDVTVDFKIGLADKLKAARERAGRV
ncbi:terminase small subunit [Pseudomonas sp. SST3]|uniref:terminase small subunit n=1 Tax=Pseudomonas sp. SST3 TaxID=2267882 RepID=UPI000E057178|nr:terminase small subunit [Pseudomonas sp. SST3]